MIIILDFVFISFVVFFPNFVPGLFVSQFCPGKTEPSDAETKGFTKDSLLHFTLHL